MAEKTKKWKIISQKVIVPRIFLYVELCIYLFILVLSIFLFYNEFSSPYCSKTTIQDQLKTVIENGGDLDAVKDAYNDRDLKKILLTSMRVETKDYYKEDVPLSVILNNLRTRYFLEIERRKDSNKTHVIKDSISVEADSLYFSLLNKIIDEYNKKNPFDKLEPNQRDIFINLQQKLDTGYVKVSDDILKVVDEMYNKNQLVAKYLDDSKTSLRISWVALLASIILSLIQIYQNRKSSKKHDKRFDEIEKKINDKE